MNDYSIALLLHIVGALGMFTALGVEWVSMQQMRHASTVEQVREWIRVPASVHRVGMFSMLTLLVSGFYMVVTVWGSVAWITVTLGTIVLMIVLGMRLTVPRMTAIGRAVKEESGPVSPNLQNLVHHPLLWLALRTRVTIMLGIVFLMTVKPELTGSLLTIGVALVLGLVSGLPMLNRRRAQEEPAT